MLLSLTHSFSLHFRFCFFLYLHIRVPSSWWWSDVTFSNNSPLSSPILLAIVFSPLRSSSAAFNLSWNWSGDVLISQGFFAKSISHRILKKVKYVLSSNYPSNQLLTFLFYSYLVKHIYFVLLGCWLLFRSIYWSFITRSIHRLLFVSTCWVGYPDLVVSAGASFSNLTLCFSLRVIEMCVCSCTSYWMLLFN